MGQQTPSTQFGRRHVETIANTVKNFKDKIGFDPSDPVQVEFFANLEIDLAHSMKADPKKFARSCMPTGPDLYKMKRQIENQLEGLTVEQIETMIKARVMGAQDRTAIAWLTLKGVHDDKADNYDDVPF